MQTRVYNPYANNYNPIKRASQTTTASLLRGTVVRNDDPKNIGRVKVRVPSVHIGMNDNDLPWCMPNSSSASNGVGSFIIPEVNSTVWVAFEDGDIYKPVWLGCAYGADTSKSGQTGNSGSKMRNKKVGATEAPEGGTDLNKKIVYKSANGAMLYFDDSDSNDGIVLTQSGNTSVVVGKGRVHMFTEGGLSIDMRDQESDIIMGYGQTSFRLSCDDNVLTAKAGDVSLKMSDDGVNLDCVDSEFKISGSQVSGKVQDTIFNIGSGEFTIDTGKAKIESKDKVKITTSNGSIDLGKGVANITAETVNINAGFVNIPRGGS